MNICFSYTNFAGCVGRAFEAVDKAVCSDCGWGILTKIPEQADRGGQHVPQNLPRSSHLAYHLCLISVMTGINLDQFTVTSQ